MKRIFVLLLFIVVCSSAFAQTETVGSIAGMIKSDLFKNQGHIKAASSSLKQVEKMMLYDEYKKDQWVPFLINFVIGAGIGSFVEGDTQGGTIALIGDIVGLGAVVLGYSTYYSQIYSGSYTTKGLGTMTIGYVVLLGTRIFEIIRPFTWTASYNSTLKGSLNYFDSISLSPSLENGMAGVTLSYKIKYN